MGDFFKQKKRKQEVEVVADPYKGIRESTSSWLTGKMQKPETYKGEMVAGMSPYEQKSLGFLEEYGKPSPVRGAATAEIQKTLEGGYDPTSSPYYQAVKAEAARNLEGTQADISDMAAGGGRYWAGARLGEQREAGTDVTIGLNKFLGELAERERARKLQVLPFVQEAEETPLRKSAAYQTLGALPREIDQARKEAIYQEWVRGTQEAPMEAARMGAGMQQAPMYGQVGYEPSAYEKWVQPWLGMGEQALMFAATGGKAGAGGEGYQGLYDMFKGMGKKKPVTSK